MGEGCVPRSHAVWWWPVRQFELVIHSLHMSIPLKVPLFVQWTRGPRTSSSPPVDGIYGLYEWAVSPLSLVVTLYQDRKSLCFRPKVTRLTIRQSQTDRVVGVAEIDLSKYVSPSTYAGARQEKLRLGGLMRSERTRCHRCMTSFLFLVDLPLGKCADKEARLVV